MGLFPKKHRIKDPVTGTAQVVACSAYRGNGTSSNLRANLVVTVPGIEPYAVEIHQMCPTVKWPGPGETLPVVVSQSNPQKVNVDWDQVGDWRDEGRTAAEQLAASMRDGDHSTDGVGEPGGSDPAVEELTRMFPGAEVHVQTVDLSGDPQAAAQLGPLVQMAEQAAGQDLDGDGVVGGATGTTAASAGAAAGAATGGGDDRIAQLERLAKLRESGALTDEEFDAEKARLLGG